MSGELNGSYEQYLASLIALEKLPGEKQQALIVAAREGVAEVRRAEERKRSVNEQWETIDSSQRQLTLEIGKLLRNSGTPPADAVQIAAPESTGEYRSEIRRLLSRVDAAGRSWDHLQRVQGEIDEAERLSRISAQAEDTSPQGAAKSSAVEHANGSKSGSKALILIVALLVVAAVVAGLLAFDVI